MITGYFEWCKYTLKVVIEARAYQNVGDESSAMRVKYHEKDSIDISE